MKEPKCKAAEHNFNPVVDKAGDVKIYCTNCGEVRDIVAKKA